MAAAPALPHSPAELAMIYLLLSVFNTLSHPQSIKALALGILINFKTSLMDNFIGMHMPNKQHIS